MVQVNGPKLQQSALCMPVLEALPDWPGVPESNANYAREINDLPTWCVWDGDRVAGFLSVKQHYETTAELYVMGVHPDRHRQGIGQALVAAAEAHLQAEGVRYLQVKTLGPSHDDPGYAQTRAFYRTMGFCPLEEFTTIWDENNPCLILIKALG